MNNVGVENTLPFRRTRRKRRKIVATEFWENNKCTREAIILTLYARYIIFVSILVNVIFPPHYTDTVTIVFPLCAFKYERCRNVFPCLIPTTYFILLFIFSLKKKKIYLSCKQNLHKKTLDHRHFFRIFYQIFRFEQNN